MPATSVPEPGSKAVYLLVYASRGAMLIVCVDLRPDRPTSADEELDDPRKKKELSRHKLIEDTYGKVKGAFVKCDIRECKNVEEPVAEAVNVIGRSGSMYAREGVAQAI